MSKNWRRGSTRAWRIIRARVLARAGYVCEVGMEGVCTGRATCVHHMLGRGVTGDNPDYLQASCTECNQAVGDPTVHEPEWRKITPW